MSGITASNTNGSINSAQYKFTINPHGLCIDAEAANMYIGDGGNNLIRKISLQNIQVSTVASNLIGPQSVAFDSLGTMYIGDRHNVRKFSNGVVTTFAGNGTADTVDGQGTNASFNTIYSICVDALGNIYAAEFIGCCIRKITPSGYVSTLAGVGGSPGFQDGQVTAALFSYPTGICIDSSGIIYVGDAGNYRIRKIVNGLVSTVAGSNTNGSNDGQGTAARMAYAYGLSIDSSNNLYFADQYYHTIRKIDASSNVTTLAGVSGVAAYEDGPAFSAKFSQPTGTAVDPSGILYISDYINRRIRKLYNGYVTTIAGDGNSSPFRDGSGSNATFAGAWGQAFDASGDLYIADQYFGSIRKITGLQYIPQTTLVAGSTAGFSNAAGAAAQFSNPLGMTINTNIYGKNILVADSGNNVIRNISIQNPINSRAALSSPLASNMVTVYAGTGDNSNVHGNMPM